MTSFQNAHGQVVATMPSMGIQRSEAGPSFKVGEEAGGVLGCPHFRDPDLEQRVNVFAGCRIVVTLLLCGFAGSAICR